MTTTDRHGSGNRAVPDPAARAMLDTLVRERGLEDWAYFFVTGEGRVFPNGVEESSGNVIAPDGRVYAFWTDWDVERKSPTFRIWEEQPPDTRWLTSSEYRRARERVGLDQHASPAGTANDTGDGADTVGATCGRPLSNQAGRAGAPTAPAAGQRSPRRARPGGPG